MIIGLHTPEKTSFPNFALSKIAKWHSSNGDTVKWWDNNTNFDWIYSSSVFTYSCKEGVPSNAVVGGTGFDIHSVLPFDIENTEPDYSVYPDVEFAYGFITRGCPNKCAWCFVPEKEGGIQEYRDVNTIAQGRSQVVFMDNNVLASNFGLSQIEKIIQLGLRVDFNQGLDCSLITDEVAKLLSKVKWLSPIRMACDSSCSMEFLRKAVELLRWRNARPTQYFVYVLGTDVESTLRRVSFVKGLYCTPFVQPFRDAVGTEPSREIRRLARYVNAGGGRAFKSHWWEEWQEYRGEGV